MGLFYTFIVLSGVFGGRYAVETNLADHPMTIEQQSEVQIPGKWRARK